VNMVDALDELFLCHCCLLATTILNVTEQIHLWFLPRIQAQPECG
jgi:hypothetical protein